MSLKESTTSILKLISHYNATAVPFEGSDGFFDEWLFNRMLDLERKRSRRSGKPFILILINIAGFSNPGPTDRLRRLEKSLAFPIRETDFRGWYLRESVIGIVFAGLNSAGHRTRESLFGKMLRELTSRMDTEDLRKIYITFYTFPTDHEDAVSCGRFDLERYRNHTKNSAAGLFSLDELLTTGQDLMGVNPCR